MPARQQPRFRRPWIGSRLLLVLLVAVVVRLLTAGFFSSADQSPPEALAEGVYAVAWVADGDTFTLANGARIRLQGIDTPEAPRGSAPGEPLHAEATAFTRRFIAAAGGQVRLTFGVERIDHYGRHLGFVWEGDVMLNEELVRAGLAHARPDYRFAGKMKRRLMSAQDQARKAGLGLWKGRTLP
ncbi:MAG: thermonuclease family protein [Planctomycetota bacterium]